MRCGCVVRRYDLARDIQHHWVTACKPFHGCPEMARKASANVGIARAFSGGVKAIRRTGLSSLASVLLVVFGAVSLAAAPDVRHRSCAAKQHECGKAAKVAARCCGNEDQNAAQAVPVQLREDSSSGSVGLCGFMKVAPPPAAPAGLSAIVHASRPYWPDPLSLSTALRL